MATEYRLRLEMNLGTKDDPDWAEVIGRIFETDVTEEALDKSIRKLENEVSK